MPNTRHIGATLLALALVACAPGEEQRAADRAAAIDLVERFGARLVYVQKLAPRDSLIAQIRDNYGPYITTLQLGGWISDPASAPGREVSSPWPARIEVRDATPVGNSAFDMDAEVIYITSVDGDPTQRQPVSIRVVKGQDDSWRISEWTTRR